MPRKKPTIKDVLNKDYFSKDEIREYIPGADFDSRKRRSDLYKEYDSRLCEKIDLSSWVNVFETKMKSRLMRINCLRNVKTNDVIFIEHGKTRYIIYFKGTKWFVKNLITGLANEPYKVRNFNFAMNLCISKMI